RLKAVRLNFEVCRTRGGLRIGAAQSEIGVCLGGWLADERATREGLVAQQRKERCGVLRTQALPGSRGGIAQVLFQVRQAGLGGEFVETRLDAERRRQRR